MKLATRYILIISALLVVIAVSALWYGNYSRRQQALREAKSKALIILNHNLAIHTYFSHQLKPKVFKVTDAVVPEGYFEPAWMSSTYAVRGIEKLFQIALKRQLLLQRGRHQRALSLERGGGL